MEKLIEIVCQYYEITEAEFWKTRKRQSCDARKIVQLLAYEKGMKITEIGNLFNQHHSTIIHSLKQAQNYLIVDIAFQTAYKVMKTKEIATESRKVLKKLVSTQELKALIELSYNAGANGELQRKERLIKLYSQTP